MASTHLLSCLPYCLISECDLQSCRDTDGLKSAGRVAIVKTAIRDLAVCSCACLRHEVSRKQAHRALPLYLLSGSLANCLSALCICLRCLLRVECTLQAQCDSSGDEPLCLLYLRMFPSSGGNCAHNRCMHYTSERDTKGHDALSF